MKLLSNYIPILLLVSIQISCKPALKCQGDIQKYINDTENGLSSTFQKGPLIITLAWQPWQLLANQSRNNQVSNSQNDKIDLSKYCYFILSMSNNKQELLRQLDYGLYSKMVQVFSFQMQSYLTISADRKEPVKPLDCLFQQTYGTSDSNRLLVVFNMNEIKDAKELSISIKEFGLGLGIMNFTIYTKNMRIINDLNTKSITSHP